jgi:hypothetical protein
MERRLAQHSSEWAGIRQRNTEEAMQKMRETADRLAASGDPIAMQDAATLRRHYYDEHMTRILNNATQDATDAISRLGVGRREEASEIVTSIIRSARDDVETVGKQIWDKVDKGITVQVQTASRVSSTPEAQWLDSDFLLLETSDHITGLADAQAIVADSLLAEATMPFEQTIMRMLKAGTATSGELLLLRQEATDAARRLSSGPNPDRRAARRHTLIAMGAEAELAKANDPFVRLASDFTSHQRQVFNRTYAAQIAPDDPYAVVPDTGEMMFDRLFGTERTVGYGGRMARRRIEDLERATQTEWVDEYAIAAGIPPSRYLDPERTALVTQESQEFLASIVNNLMDTDGNITTRQLQNFLRRYKDVLEMFPTLRMNLQDAESAAIVVNNLRNAQRQADQFMLNRDAFSRFAGNEDGSYVIDSIVSGETPEATYRELARRARQISEGTYTYDIPGQEAIKITGDAHNGVVGGLKAATIDYAYQAAVSTNSIDWLVFRRSLFEPLSRGRSSLAQIMREEGVITETELLNLRRLTDRAIRVQQAESNPQEALEILGNVDAFWDLATRALGSRMASNAMGTSAAGPSLIVAAGGARLGRSLLTGTPNSKFIDQMMVLAGSPELTARALSNTATLPAQRQLGRQLNAFLISAGLPSYDLDYLEEQEFPEMWD